MRLILALLLCSSAAAACAAECAPAALHLLRHAEKAELPGEADPVLSEAGQRRAAALVEWAQGRRIDAIYVTHLRRTQQTAAPLAAVRDLELRLLPAGDTPRLLARLGRAHCGAHVLLVGHSNTVPGIAQAFGAAPFEIGEAEFGTVYSLYPPDSTLGRERFGAAQ